MSFLKLSLFVIAFTPLIIMAQDNNDSLKKDSSRSVYCDFFRSDVITPNGDGLNDCFPYIDSLNNFKDIKITIFNKNGVKVFENNDSNKCWNGRKNNTGKDCPDGAYYYVFENKKEAKLERPIITGAVNLIRNP